MSHSIILIFTILSLISIWKGVFGFKVDIFEQEKIDISLIYPKEEESSLEDESFTFEEEPENLNQLKWDALQEALFTSKREYFQLKDGHNVICHTPLRIHSQNEIIAEKENGEMEDKSAIELILMDFKHKCFPNYYGKYKYNICPGVNIDQTELIGEQSKYSLGTKSPTAFDKYRTNDIKNYIIKPFISIQDNLVVLFGMDLNHNLKKIEITFPNTDQKEIFNITKIFPKSRLMLISNTKAISSNLITNYSFIKGSENIESRSMTIKSELVIYKNHIYLGKMYKISFLSCYKTGALFFHKGKNILSKIKNIWSDELMELEEGSMENNSLGIQFNEFVVFSPGLYTWKMAQGNVSVSNSSVYGNSTAFIKQLRVGDIVAFIPNNLSEILTDPSSNCNHAIVTEYRVQSILNNAELELDRAYELNKTIFQLDNAVCIFARAKINTNENKTPKIQPLPVLGKWTFGSRNNKQQLVFPEQLVLHKTKENQLIHLQIKKYGGDGTKSYFRLVFGSAVENTCLIEFIYDGAFGFILRHCDVKNEASYYSIEEARFDQGKVTDIYIYITKGRIWAGWGSYSFSNLRSFIAHPHIEMIHTFGIDGYLTRNIQLQFVHIYNYTPISDELIDILASHRSKLVYTRSEGPNHPKEIYTNGSICAFDKKPRSATIIYICSDEGKIFHLKEVKETNICKYELVVETKFICPPYLNFARIPQTQIKCYPN